MSGARVSRAEREAHMLEVATEVFCQRGYAGASMNEIARRCGITKPMLYLYFDSKDGLYLACLRFVGEGLIAAVEAAVAGARTPFDRVMATARGLFEYAEQRDRAWWGVIYAETMPANGTVAAAMADYRGRIFAIVRRSTVDLFDDPVDADMAAHALIGAGEALLRWWVRRPADTAAELTGRLEQMLGRLLPSRI